MTYTYAVLELSKPTVDEISEKLRTAGYEHAFHDGVVDMHGIAVRPIEPPVTEAAAAWQRRVLALLATTPQMDEAQIDAVERDWCAGQPVAVPQLLSTARQLHELRRALAGIVNGAI